MRTMAPAAAIPTEQTLYQQFGQRLAEFRKSRNMSQQDLADGIGLTNTSIANIEAGRQRVYLHQLFRIANAFGVTLNDIMTAPSSRAWKEYVVSREPGISEPAAKWIARIIASEMMARTETGKENDRD